MKRLILFLLACSAFAAECPSPITNGYSYCRKIVISHLMFAGSVSNFPVGKAGTLHSLANINNGGHVTNVNGYDIVFTSDAAGTTLITWETSTYNPNTGQFEFWWKIASPSTSVDTEIFMYYGNASITTSQTTATAVWDANYLGVWHFGDGVTISLADSTSNANNLTSHGTPFAVAGKVGGGVYMNGAVVATFFTADGTKSNISGTPLSIEAWGNFQGVFLNNLFPAFLYKKTPSSTQGFELIFAAADSSPNTPNLFYYENEGGSFITDTEAIPLSTWFQMAVTYGLSGTANHADILRNGVLQASGLVGTGFPVSSTGNVLEVAPDWTGPVDEIRLSNTNRSLAWIQSGYNNQNNPNLVQIHGEAPSTVTVVIQ